MCGKSFKTALCQICRIVIVDEADSWSRQLLEEGVIERFIPFDFSDQETVFERCMAVIKRIEKVLPFPCLSFCHLSGLYPGKS